VGIAAVTGRTIVTAVGAAAVASSAYQRVGEARDRKRFPPPGRLVDVGGRRLHVWPVDGDGPTLVAVPALGGPGLDWMRIRRAAAPLPVCIYDRAGLGWSDPGPWPRTAGAMADELHLLLKAADVPSPYVLVGNSLGGLVARMFVARHPGQVGGLVLVDSSHEDQRDRLSLYDTWRRRVWAELRGVRWLLKWRGVRRAAVELGLDTRLRASAVTEFPPELVNTGVAVQLTSAHRRAAAQEMLCWTAGADELRAEAGHLGPLPLTVITAGPARRDSWYPQWLELQHELARLSDDCVHIIADHAGHFVHHDDPDLVVNALRDAVERARAFRPDQQV
jgi:pimeloyl-ACP methyl ester carboxylesterase